MQLMTKIICAGGTHTAIWQSQRLSIAHGRRVAHFSNAAQLRVQWILLSALVQRDLPTTRYKLTQRVLFIRKTTNPSPLGVPMQNILLSHNEFRSIMMQEASPTIIGIGEYRLFGFPILLNEHGALIYCECEYCGQSKRGSRNDCAKCGAPLSNQGVRLTKRAADGAILSAIIEALYGTPRR